MIDRRKLIGGAAALAATTCLSKQGLSIEGQAFKLRFILSSCMYGYEDVRRILPEVKKSGATAIDIWPKVHGNQREQLEKIGVDEFKSLIAEEGVDVGCLTQYKLGPFGLRDEMNIARELGCKTIVTGGKGPVGLKGDDLKSAVKNFVGKMKEELAIAKENNVVIAVENHARNLIDSEDSLKWMVEFGGENLGVALAPYHLPQDSRRISRLIGDLGERIHMFYAWQHGKGCMKKLPKEEELLQMPGRGSLDFGPMLAALEKVGYQRWTSIFMHPVPRGIPILDTTEKVTAEINRARKYLESKL